MPGRNTGSRQYAKEYLQRLSPERGVRRAIDDNGDLLVRRVGKDEPSARQLDAALAQPSWLDPRHRRAAVVKLLRTIRLDPSDTFVFERAAAPGEWAVSGAFAFWNEDVGALRARRARRFAAGFLACNRSAGRRWCRSWKRPRKIVRRSSARWRSNWWSDLARRTCDGAARPKRKSRLRSRCAISRPDTLIAVHRTFEDGETREAFRTLHPRGGRSRCGRFHSSKSRARKSRPTRSTWWRLRRSARK